MKVCFTPRRVKYSIIDDTFDDDITVDDNFHNYINLCLDFHVLQNRLFTIDKSKDSTQKNSVFS